MASDNEAVADICAKMREPSIYKGRIPVQRVDADFRYFADRIEAAYRREVGVGNAAKMREALEIAKKAICNHARRSHICDSLAWENSTINANCGDILCGFRDLCEAKTAIQEALAAPIRNCDVGTAEEQLKRFKDFCRIISKDETCDGCPLLPQCSELEHCTLAWSQMPYKEGGAK